MPASTYVRPTVWVPPAIAAVLQPQPPLAPSIPPVHVVDLMTEAGSAAFGARWRVKAVKLVECPALTNSLPELKITYDIEGRVLPVTGRPCRAMHISLRLWLEYSRD